jgi:lysophospholipase L1-like esterase
MQKILLVLVFILNNITAFSQNKSNNKMTHQQTILCLGDSYTIGERVPETDRFPVQLVKMLHEKNKNFADPVITARTGWTTDELITAIKERNLQGTFDYVTLLIGVNNQYRGYSTDIYRKEFKELLQTAINYAGGNTAHVIVISIPDWGVTPFASNEGRDKSKVASEIDLYNSINKEETLNARAQYADITAISRQAATNQTLLAGDGLHPSGKMYTLWCEQILPLVK